MGPVTPSMKEEQRYNFGAVNKIKSEMHLKFPPPGAHVVKYEIRG